MKKLILFLVICVMVCGCASAALQKHQSRLQELDAQYKSGQIDAVQYQTKYSEEVQDYNLKTVTSVDLLGRRKYR